MNDDALEVEFHDPGRLGPEVEMPPELLAVAELLNGTRSTVREAMEAFESAAPGCTVYDQGDCIAVGFGERVEVIPGTTLHTHNYRAIRMRAVETIAATS